ncbi:Conserved_hypothetical protein [Hexamita inflata]|uniref:Uncharacterized protein n=1 Tax=Hexamita inflata TaxID=28002 RepID=A0AA86QWH8_9EUKA|nr:Conserved hypothetical protein [Hexamita inflata]
MESFPDQFKRHQFFYPKLYKQSLNLVKKYIALSEVQQEMSETLNELAQTELVYNRPPMLAFAELLLCQAASTAAQTNQLAALLQTFDISDELQVAKTLAADQKKYPNRQTNSVFAQNASNYQQNRQIGLQNAMRGASNVFMAQAAALFESATNLRRQADAIDPRASVVDVARRLAHLDVGVPIEKMLGVEHIVKDFNLNGSTVKNAKLTKRGAAMGENSVKTSTLIPESQIPIQMSVKEPPLQSSKMDALNQQYPEVLIDPVLQTSPKLISNDYVSLAKSPNSNQPQAIPNQLYSQTQQSLKQPDDSVHMYTQKTSPQRTQKIYQTKTYEFGSSLFEEDSDEKPNIFIKPEQIDGIEDDEEIIRKAQLTSAKNTKNNEEVKLMSEQLKQQMEEMENMMKQLTNPTETQIKVKEIPKQEAMKLEDSIPKMEFDEPIAVSQKPLGEIKEKKALPPMKSKSEREKQNDNFKNMLVNAIQQQKEDDKGDL